MRLVSAQGAALVTFAACFAVALSCDERPNATMPTAPHKEPALQSTTDASVLVGAGDIAYCGTSGAKFTAQILDTIPGTVFALGDNAYPGGSATDYSTCYDSTWGRHKARTRPAPGDLDYKVAGASGYFGYFGAAAGDPTQGYYSYDLGAWHVIVLNSSISVGTGSAEWQWLKADIAASTKSCTVAYWHYPLFSSSGTPIRSWVKPLWDLLYGAGAEVVLNAELRAYERFAPQTPSGVADTAFGIREFIVGTGGSGYSSFGTTIANSEVRIANTAGVLKLTLADGSYTWKFIPRSGQTATDGGSGTCHGAPPPVANAGGPYSSQDTVAFDGSNSYDPAGNTPLSYAWNFGDGSTGTGVAPTHVYAAKGTYTATLTVTNSKGASSSPATAKVTITNVPPQVIDATYMQLYPTQNVKLRIPISDAADTSPWTYTIAWGDGATSQGSLTSLTNPLIAGHGYPALGSYAAHITVADSFGAKGSYDLLVVVRESSNAQVFVGAGDISTCSSNNDELTSELLDGISGTVFTVGDNAYPNGSATDYTNCYDPTWGRHKARTYAALGNHEYSTGTATPAFDYFGDRVGPRDKGYYSFDLGSWHIIVLNDNSSYVSYDAGSAQDQWLQTDLAATQSRCVLAIWHGPRFYSGNTVTYTNGRKNLWDRLYSAGAELILNGHMHFYERFAPQTSAGARDDAHGIREIIVGTGGGGLDPLTVVRVNSQARSPTYGVLKLTLNVDSYTWEFIPIAGQSFTDFGTAACH